MSMSGVTSYRIFEKRWKFNARCLVGRSVGLGNRLKLHNLPTYRASEWTSESNHGRQVISHPPDSHGYLKFDLTTRAAFLRVRVIPVPALSFIWYQRERERSGAFLDSKESFAFPRFEVAWLVGWLVGYVVLWLTLIWFAKIPFRPRSLSRWAARNKGTLTLSK